MIMSEWHTKTIDAYTMKDVENAIQELRAAGWYVGGYQYTNSKNTARIEFRWPEGDKKND
jgi:hypothetical protein